MDKSICLSVSWVSKDRYWPHPERNKIGFHASLKYFSRCQLSNPFLLWEFPHPILASGSPAHILRTGPSLADWTRGGHLTQNGPVSYSLGKVGLRTLESLDWLLEPGICKFRICRATMCLEREKAAYRDKEMKAHAQRWKTIWPVRETDTHIQTGSLVFAIFRPQLPTLLRPDYSTFSCVPWSIPHFLTNKFPL